MNKLKIFIIFNLQFFTNLLFSPIYAEEIKNASQETINWHLIETTGSKPSPRGAGTWTPIGTKLIAIGGLKECFNKKDPACQHIFFDDVFVLDITTNHWEKKNPSAHSEVIPSKRAFFASSPYTKNKTVIIYGGVYFDSNLSTNEKKTKLSAPKTYDDMWEYDSSADKFTRRVFVNKGPGPRAGAGVVIKNDTLYLFGGRDNSFANHNDVWSYDLVKNNWHQLLPDNEDGSSPSKRYLPLVELNKIGEDIFIYGGEYRNQNQTNATLVGDLWKYNIPSNSFTELLPENKSNMKPRARAAIAVFDNYLFIAMGDNQDPTNEVWAMNIGSDTPSFQWIKVPTNHNPPPLERIFYATANGKLYITLGFDFKCAVKGCREALYNQDTYSLFLDQVNLLKTN